MRSWLLATLFLAGTAAAGTADVSWQKPTQNCDGSTLTDLKGFRVYWGSGRQELANPATQSFTVSGLTPGVWWFGVTAYNSANVESALTTPVFKTVLPANFVTVETVVYTVVKATDKFLFLPVGTIAKGVICDPAQPVGRYYVVPRGSVVWSGNVKPVVVVAACG